MKNVSPSHYTHTGTDYGWPSERTVVNQTVSSSRSLLSARVPASESDIQAPFPARFQRR